MKTQNMYNMVAGLKKTQKTLNIILANRNCVFDELKTNLQV